MKEILPIIKLCFSPLLSLFILVLGSGLFTTLTTVRLHIEGSSAFMIGAMTSAYYAGLMVASFGVERSIIRVGHIRAFSAFASALAVATLLQGLIVIPWLWLFFRFVGGFATAGLFVVIESWLLISGTIRTRGQVLALYMITLYAAQASGQFFMNIDEPTNLTLFAIVAMLSSMSVIPLAMSNVGAPQFGEPSSLSIKALYKKSTSGVIGCFIAGLILSAIYGLLPLFVSEKTPGDEHNVALFMALVIFGGMALQYPLGKLSDHIERRVVLIMVAIASVLMSLIMIFSFQWYWPALIATFLFGGFSFAIYPISTSHACDTLSTKEIISATQGLLLAYSAGAMIGPFVAPIFMSQVGANGLFIYFIITGSLLAAILLWRRVRTTAVPQEEQFVPLPQTTPITAELDPRSNDEIPSKIEH